MSSVRKKDDYRTFNLPLSENPYRRCDQIIDLFNKQSGICHYCEYPMTLKLGFHFSATIDHKHPRTHGGLNSYFNYVASCKCCNETKANNTYIWAIRNKPMFMENRIFLDRMYISQK